MRENRMGWLKHVLKKEETDDSMISKITVC